MFGSGLFEFEDFMRWVESMYLDKFCGWVGFFVFMVYCIIVGCDILFMFLCFELCGLN